MAIKKPTVLISIVLVLCLLVLTACSAPDGGQKNSGGDGEKKTVQIDTAAGTEESGSAAGSSGLDYSAMFTERDMRTSWSAGAASKILLEGEKIRTRGEGLSVSGGTAVIESGGTYYISGTLADGQIIVDVSDKEKVQLVLDGAGITCSSSACILVKSADKVFVTLADGSENVLSDTGDEYVQSDESMNVDAVVFSKSDIVFNGTGSLTVEAGYHDAIVSKDDLKFTGGSYEINAADKGIVGKDSLRIRDGAFKIVSEDDCLVSNNDEKAGKGYIYVEGGEFSLETGDGAVRAAGAVVIRGGKIDILQSYEGIEGHTVDIEGGTVSIVSADDGFNASTDAPGVGGNEVETTCHIRVAGGSVYVNAGGDGLDSNGTILMEGGCLIVDGPENDGNSALDAGMDIVVSGGTLLTAGSSGLAKAPSEKSPQKSVFYLSPQKIPGGTEVELSRAGGKAVCSFTPSKTWSCLILSDPGIKEGTYTLRAGDQQIQVETGSAVSSAGEGSK
jgi:hypothetical protein